MIPDDFDVMVWANNLVLARAVSNALFAASNYRIGVEAVADQASLVEGLASSTGPVDLVVSMSGASVDTLARIILWLGSEGWEGRCVGIVPATAIDEARKKELWGRGTYPFISEVPGFTWIPIPPHIADIFKIFDKMTSFYRETWLRIVDMGGLFRLAERMSDATIYEGCTRQNSDSGLLAQELCEMNWDLFLPHADARQVREAIDVLTGGATSDLRNDCIHAIRSHLSAFLAKYELPK